MMRGLRDLLWPQGGWVRAFHYVKHRVRRLPDSPERIARGIWAGVFATFLPFYGLHFLLSAGVALLVRGNIFAALMATFFGNPLTYVPIGIVSLRTGYAIMGIPFSPENSSSIGHQFTRTFADLWHNLMAVFTPQVARWDDLIEFYHTIFIPYLIGGPIPGAVVATVCYYLSLPLIRAYQKRRKGTIKAKLAALKARRARNSGS